MRTTHPIAVSFCLLWVPPSASSDYALDIATQVWVDVCHGLAGACSQRFPEVAEALLEDGKDARDELLNGVPTGILDA